MNVDGNLVFFCLPKVRSVETGPGGVLARPAQGGSLQEEQHISRGHKQREIRQRNVQGKFVEAEASRPCEIR